MLTATPIQNRVWDLYSLVDLLTTAKGHRNPLGQPSEFQSMYIADSAGRKINPQRAEQFRSILAQYMDRTRREDAKLQFPAREVVTRRLPATEVERRMQSLAAEHIARLNALIQISLGQAMMSSPQALATQLENMASRDSALRVAAERARSLADSNPRTAKLEGLLTLIHELRQRRPSDWRVLVFTVRKETQTAIGKALEAEGIAHGFIRGAQMAENQRAIKRFRATHPEINVIISTDAGAEGVNLQVCNILVNYDLPWNPMIVEQRIGRVQRLGTAHENVIITNLAVANSVEERVVPRLLEKLQVIAHTIGDIETILEAAGQDDEGRFEDVIRKLVVDSLRGVNVEEKARMEAESIERARRRMEDERRQIEETLGGQSSQANEELRPPRVSLAEPSMRPEDFVLKALSAEGATIHACTDDTLEVIWRGRPSERITFKPEVVENASSGLFMGNMPKLYLPGRPPFERLVQRWLQRSGHYVRDLSANLLGQVSDTAAKWCATVPGVRFVSAEIADRRLEANLQLTCRATAANGVDSLEKLVSVCPRMDKGDLLAEQDFAAAPVLRKAMTAKELPISDNDEVASSVVSDSSIREFCEFYTSRLREEAGKTGGDSWRRQKLEADLAPKVFAEVVGMRGVRYDIVVVRTSFIVDESHEYTVELTLLPAASRVLSEPARHQCAISGRSLPEPCMSRCDITGVWAVKHLLVQSAKSGRRALPDHAVTCSVSGITLLSDEVSTSALTGKCAAKECFRESPISGRIGLPEDFAHCAFSGDDVLRDELVQSEVSGRMYRKDQGARCAISGRAGHSSEFMRCGKSGDVLLPEHTDVSAVSGLRVRRDLLMASEKPPHRKGLQVESVTCSQTGQRLLNDEVAMSAVSGKPVEKDLLVASDVSGQLALPEEMVRCAITGDCILPKEAQASDLSGRLARRDLVKISSVSGRRGLTDEFVKCEITGVDALRDELLLSEQSGRRFRKDEAERSEESGRIAHKTEMATCAASKKLLLQKEVAASSASGLIYAKSLLVASEKNPSRLATPGECVQCAKTGKRLIADEAAFSAASGKPIDKDLLVRSAVSDRLALPEEMATCEETQRRLLPDEIGTCSITGRKVGKDQLQDSQLSGKQGLRKLMVRCAATEKYVLPDELALCELTGKHVLPSELAVCSVTHKRVMKDQLLSSDLSGALVLTDHAIRSPLTKRVCLPTEAVECAWLGERLPRDEVSSCRLTGLPIARVMLNKSNELRELRELLDGRVDGVDAADLMPLLTDFLRDECRGLRTVSCTFSKDGRARAVCGESRTMLGLKVRYVGAVVSDRDGPCHVVGRRIWGRRDGVGWAPAI